MAHKFNPKNKHKLDRDERKEKMPPFETLKKLKLKEGLSMLDVGAGTGYFSIPASKIVGDNNHVYASDISNDMLELIKEKINNKNIKNIKVIKGEEYYTKLDTKVDYILLSNVFHEVEDKNKFLNNYLSYLNEEGLIAFIEWKKKNTHKGPPKKDRLNDEDINNILHKYNMKIIKTVDINDTHYGLVARKIKQ